jgi:glycine/D-amino acid oxidase-like deaminating enzyme
MPRDHILIAGAGIIGASIAYHLAKRGARVTIAEAQRPAAGATGKSFGWINATFSKRPCAYYELNVLGMAEWRRLEIDLDGELKVQWGGSVAWCPSGPEAEELRQNVHDHQQWGYATQLIHEEELRRLLPAVSPGACDAACYCEQEGAVDPVDAASLLLRKAREFGAELQCPREVTTLDLEAGTIVLACGVDLPRLAQMAGVHAPLKDSPGVLVHTAPLPRLIHSVVLAPGVHFKQTLDGRIVAGGQVVAGAGTAVTAANVDQAGEIFRQAVRFLPQLQDAAIEHVTLGYRVMPQDEYPILGFAERCPNIYLAATHSGVTLAPLIGRLAALEILDGVPVSLLDPYRPSRFA